MTPRVPDAWAFVLLALAAYRLYRLGAKDTITEPLRAAATYPDDQAVALGDDPADRLEVVGRDAKQPKAWRVYLATLIRCPWCAGFYVSVVVWVAWLLEPRWALWAATPWAISAVVGLVKKTLDP